MIPERGCVEDQPQRIRDVQAAATGFQHRSRSGGCGFAALGALVFIRGSSSALGRMGSGGLSGIGFMAFLQRAL